MESPGVRRWLSRVIGTGLLIGVMAHPSPTARAVTGTNPSTQWAPLPYDDLPGDVYQHISALEVYRGELTVAVRTSGPTQIWRTADGLSWTGVITTTSFASDSLGSFVIDFAEQGDALYASTYLSGRGAAIWRTSDGDRWEPVTPLWAADTYYLGMAGYSGQLYVDKMTVDPGGVVATHTIEVTSNGLDWSTALAPDFTVSSVSVSGDGLYVGGDRSSDQATCLWRFDGSSWSDVSSGFQQPASGHVLAITRFGDALYAAVGETLPDQRIVIAIWRSPDGARWEQPEASDDVAVFQASMGFVTQASLIVYRGGLFLFTYDLRGGGVWRSPDGMHWDAVAPRGWGSGQARGVSRAGAAVFRDQLWAGLVESPGPAEVMLYLPIRHLLPAVLNAASVATPP